MCKPDICTQNENMLHLILVGCTCKLCKYHCSLGIMKWKLKWWLFQNLLSMCIVANSCLYVNIVTHKVMAWFTVMKLCM